MQIGALALAPRGRVTTVTASARRWCVGTSLVGGASAARRRRGCARRHVGAVRRRARAQRNVRARLDLSEKRSATRGQARRGRVVTRGAPAARFGAASFVLSASGRRSRFGSAAAAPPPMSAASSEALDVGALAAFSFSMTQPSPRPSAHESADSENGQRRTVRVSSASRRAREILVRQRARGRCKWVRHCSRAGPRKRLSVRARSWIRCRRAREKRRHAPSGRMVWSPSISQAREHCRLISAS